ncbi:hypothetical protein Cpir12675_001771 [Ceratocystis pirilliformis]|uniref:Centromere protein X n=1 Tax=Ceratocystis pirilliformis TaxID=259994 RepID=A0ABR3ZE44_9PEZI
MPPMKKIASNQTTTRSSKSASGGDVTTLADGNNSASDTEQVDGEAKVQVPEELITRVLHDMFEKENTRISKDANRAVGKYLDVFIREALMRASAERGARFLEVEDLERLAPQLLLDF